MSDYPVAYKGSKLVPATTVPSGFDVPAAQISGTLPVANGGTSATTLAANGVLYGNGTSAVGVAGTGTAGQVLTSNGSGSAPSMQNPITGTSSLATLSTAAFLLSTTNYENIGLAITLPSAGTYLVVAHARANIQVSAAAPAEMTHKLVNITDAADITNSEAYGPLATATGVLFTAVTPLSAIVTVAASKSIGVYSKVNAGPTYTTRQIVSDTSGRSTIYYVKLSP